MTFLRTSTKYYKRLGKNSKKKQRWRKPRGRHNKIRQKMKGRLTKVTIGFKTAVKKDMPVLVRNIREAGKITKEQMIIIGKVGRNKRKEIEKIVAEKGAKILNRIKERK